MSVQEYLDKHMLARKIEDAVNAAVRAKTTDPVLFISNHMKKAVPSAITKIKARQILDSRGIPTVEVDLYTNKGMYRASVPSGVPCGMYEAVEVRDGEKGKYLGKGVSKAVKNVNEKISEALIGMDPSLQSQIDQTMMDLDKTENKAGSFLAIARNNLYAEIGANAMLAVSIAACKAGAAEKDVPLYQHIADLSGKGDPVLPIPAITVLSGGRHAGNNLAAQSVIVDKHGSCGCNVGEDGGFASNVSRTLLLSVCLLLEKLQRSILPSKASLWPLLSISEGLDLVKEAIDRAGYKGRIKLAVDVGATEFCIDYPIASIEQPFDKDDWEHTKLLSNLGICQVVGDDLLMSNPKRIEKAIKEGTCNALLLKISQVGTVTEAIEVVKQAKDAQWGVIVSHRSGETEDSFIADLAVGLATGQIKAGAPCRGERLAKYNQLLRIEEELGDQAVYARENWRMP
ncbi:Cytosolic enolase 3 [Apostasia shenzhenica]|uniref:phosphopyruvate hydratase n=1 Tax=Apostasia shenzhenica TaxID=1088818 RepID=A0A2I0AAC2_9ASPA|nr:Cytosolic enolase 3 [Apostasia shenzhenica]